MNAFHGYMQIDVTPCCSYVQLLLNHCTEVRPNGIGGTELSLLKVIYNLFDIAWLRIRNDRVF